MNRFIAFEGPDGCGKGTQKFLLGKYIDGLSKYEAVHFEREPYRNRDIREILKEDDAFSKARHLADLFVQDRKEHVQERILPSLESGAWLICDRYRLSTFAYQHAQGISLEDIAKLQKDLPIPALSIIVDVPADVGLTRIALSGVDVEKKFEQLDFQIKVRKAYLSLPDYLNGERIVVIDGNRDVDAVALDIRKAFEETFFSRICSFCTKP